MMRRPIEGYVSIIEACRILHLTRQAIYLAIKKGRISCKKSGRYIYLSIEDLKNYHQNRYNRDLRKENGEYLFNINAGRLSVKQTAKLLAEILEEYCDIQKVYYLVRVGKIKASRCGGVWVVRKDSVLKFAETQKIPVIIDDYRKKFI